ncbi:MAG: beta-ketoacyl-ACP synthase II [Candidatus Paracaedibacteraceae bacterium]|nr:beta-ketoacyl-ACP synthase II [Candidatus Paracaedibacteraceae bacterium]
MKRRVVITGLGLVTPLGCGVTPTWKNLIAGKSGIRRITAFDPTNYQCQVAGQVPEGKEPGQFDIDAYVPYKDQKKMDRFIHLGLAAAKMALEDAGWQPEDEHAKERTGVSLGAGIGGLPEIERTAINLHENGPRRISPFFIPASLINLLSGHVSINYGFKGPNHAVVTACASGVHSIGDAARMIQYGDAEVMVAGAAEASVCPIGIGGFAALRALSTKYNDTPEKASRPWDKGRDGFVMGEGAGIVILEELEHALNRGAKIYAEYKGYGMSSDAYHMTSPPEDGAGAYRAMKAALKDANLNPEELDYINAHGTSTPVGDVIEHRAVKRLLDGKQHNLSMSSTKSAIGHLLGAAGGVETIFSILALRDQIVPPTLNLEDPEGECDLDLVPLVAKNRKVEHVLCNSFGFGGTNASIVLSKWND